MIENFEDITGELSADELVLIPLLIKGFKKHTKDNPIKAGEIVKNMNLYAEKNALPKMNDARLRKCVNHIRTNGLLPVIATSNGYYTSTDRAEIESQIKSLRQRASSILRCADGLGTFLPATI